MFANEGTQGLKRIKETPAEDKYGLEEFKEATGLNRIEEEEIVMKGGNDGNKMMEENEMGMDIPDEESDVSFEDNQTGNLMESAIQEEFIPFNFL